MKIPKLGPRKPGRPEQGEEPLTEETDHEEEGPADESTSPLTWTGGSAAVTRAVTFFLFGCLIAGPVALLLGVGGAFSPPSAPTKPTSQSTGTAAGERAAVEAFAQDFVSVWLTSPNGHEAKLARFVPHLSELSLPARPWSVADPSTADIEKSRSGAWAVTVSVLVDDEDRDGSVRRYFRVPVAYDEEKLVAQSLPTPVAAPPVGHAPELGYENRAAASDALTIAATDFLNALLVGGEDVTRYISPGADIRPVSPPPYNAIEVTDVLVDTEIEHRAGASLPNGKSVHALVSATATAAKTQQISIQYALTLTVREGRWEVSSVDLAPLLKPEEATPSQETS